MAPRAVWLVGDSITQEMMRAMQCFFSELGGLQPVAMTDDADAEAVIRGEAGVTPWCINLPQASRVCHIRCNLGERGLPSLPVVPLRGG